MSAHRQAGIELQKALLDAKPMSFGSTMIGRFLADPDESEGELIDACQSLKDFVLLNDPYHMSTTTKRLQAVAVLFLTCIAHKSSMHNHLWVEIEKSMAPFVNGPAMTEIRSIGWS